MPLWALLCTDLSFTCCLISEIIGTVLTKSFGQLQKFTTKKFFLISAYKKLKTSTERSLPVQILIKSFDSVFGAMLLVLIEIWRLFEEDRFYLYLQLFTSIIVSILTILSTFVNRYILKVGNTELFLRGNEENEHLKAKLSTVRSPRTCINNSSKLCTALIW